MECTINGVTYVSIDSPVNDYKQYSYKECDIIRLDLQKQCFNNHCAVMR